MACTRCQDTRWVCEAHPDKPMDHDDCEGAGMPCPICNPSSRAKVPTLPPLFEIAENTTAKRSTPSRVPAAYLNLTEISSILSQAMHLKMRRSSYGSGACSAHTNEVSSPHLEHLGRYNEVGLTAADLSIAARLLQDTTGLSATTADFPPSANVTMGNTFRSARLGACANPKIAARGIPVLPDPYARQQQ